MGSYIINNQVQVLLAEMLNRPQVSLMDLAKSLFPDSPQDVFFAAKEIIEKVLNIQLKTSSNNEVPPTLIDRLSFCWKILKDADQIVKKQKKNDIPVVIKPEYLKSIFSTLLPLESIDIVFIETVCDILMIAEDGCYLHDYYEFLKSQKPKKLQINVKSGADELNKNNISRLSFWILRNDNIIYVESDSNNSIRYHYSYLVERIREKLFKWIDVPQKYHNILGSIIEEQIDKWLNYSCLDSTSIALLINKTPLIKQFIKYNKLTIPLATPKQQYDDVAKHKIQELEIQISNYIQENKNLEDQISQLNEKLKSVSVTPEMKILSSQELSDNYNIKNIIDLLITIDSKYSFDTLNNIQLGEQTSLTMKNFLKHFFYSLRKKGLISYPETDGFFLSYDECGLYICQNFQIMKGETKKVTVIQKGWAIQTKSNLYPIRKAILEFSNGDNR